MLAAFFTFFYELLINISAFKIALWFFPLYYSSIFLFYPIIYKYLVVTIGDANERLIIKIFNSLPVVILLITFIFYLPLSNDEKIIFVQSNMETLYSRSHNFGLYLNIIIVILYLQISIFITIFYQMYLLNKKKIKRIGDTQSLSLPAWLFIVITGILIYELIGAFVLFFGAGDYSEIFNQTANLILILFLGFLGIQHDEMLIKMELEKLGGEKIIRNKYKAASIPETEAGEIINEIKNYLVDQKIYLNPALKIDHLAKKNHLSVNLLSEIINKYEGKNFSQFINSFRIEKAKELLSGIDSKIKIQDLYLEVGFYSRSTFNRAFKSITGKTPTEFLNSIK